MKKILFLAAFVLMAGVSVSAQSEAKKSCDKPCTHTEKASASVESGESTAVMAAAKNENIHVKTCETSGNVSFYRKDVCEESGKVSYTEVEYLETSGEFSVKAEDVPASKSSELEAVGSKTVKAKSSSSSKEKACCSSKSAKASSKSCSPAARAKSGCSSKSASTKKSCGTKS